MRRAIDFVKCTDPNCHITRDNLRCKYPLLPHCHPVFEEIREVPAPLDFMAAHDKKHGPDAQFVCRDDQGVKWFTFSASYETCGQRFSFHFWALDMADAQKRLTAIQANAKLDGQLYSEIRG